MTRLSYLVCFLILISTEVLGQCVNRPTVTLSSTSGTTCGLTLKTVGGNTFGGSATRITISENGAGRVSPVTITTSPFTFTYTPASGDIGKKILITVTTNNPLGKRCSAARLTYTLTVNSVPSSPESGTVTQPTCLTARGTAVLKGLPTPGTWSLTRNPDGTILSGSGTTATVSDLAAGKYMFSVTNSAGCVSGFSGEVEIFPSPAIPIVKISDPAPVCFPSTADLTVPSITTGSSSGLTYSYWKNSSATLSYNSPSKASEGIYYVKGTIGEKGCAEVKPVKVTVKLNPVANAGPDKVLDYKFITQMEAISPGINETGSWAVLSGPGLLSDYADSKANVRNLMIGNNIFLWSLTNGVCPPSHDTVNVTVKDLVIPSLITPNMDGKNDYFVISWNESLGKIELVIFDRRGVQVYKNLNYDNHWNGLDSDGNLLLEDTYFYLIKIEKGKSASGFIMIRR